jgi:hypothetical protein
MKKMLAFVVSMAFCSGLMAEQAELTFAQKAKNLWNNAIAKVTSINKQQLKKAGYVVAGTAAVVGAGFGAKYAYSKYQAKKAADKTE